MIVKNPVSHKREVGFFIMVKPESLYLMLSIADRLKAYLEDCLEKGIKRGEFNRVPVSETVHLLIAMINGLIRQRWLCLEEKKVMRNVTDGRRWVFAAEVLSKIY
jgi:hypothetical protein